MRISSTKSAIAACSAACLVAGSLLLAAPASAAPASGAGGQLGSLADVTSSDGSLLNPLTGDALTSGATISPTDPIVISDGTAEVIDTAAVAGSSLGTRGIPACGSNAFAAVGGRWGAESRARCALAGSNGLRAGYKWEVNGAGLAQACTQGRGFNASRVSFWGSTGCGEHANAGVAWGNVLDYQKFKIRSMSGVTGVMAFWH
jgi:hypothetical protein